MSASTNPIMPCEDCPEVVSLSVETVSSEADSAILHAKWKNKEKESIALLKHDDTAYIDILTQGFSDGDEITIEIKEDKENGETLKTLTLKIKNNEVFTSEDEAPKVEETWYGKMLVLHVSSDKIDETFIGDKIPVKCCANCITKGESGDLIKEINIRLAGFGEGGCPLPKNGFDELTEMAVKQFQRDYMKVAQTGIVCKHFLEKLDKFCEDYYIKFETDTNFNIKCPCLTTTATTGAAHKCTDGFGLGRASLASPQKSGPEKPGVHRSLLWALSAMKFYLDKVETSDGIKFSKFSSAYRCIADNIRQSRNSTNHMGNAIDIQFSGSSGSNTTRADKARELFAIYCGAYIRWTPSGNNNFCMEPSIASYYDTKKEKKDDPNNPGKKIEEEVRTSDEFTATSWVHIDCREFNGTNYQKDEFYM